VFMAAFMTFENAHDGYDYMMRARLLPNVVIDGAAVLTEYALNHNFEDALRSSPYNTILNLRFHDSAPRIYLHELEIGIISPQVRYDLTQFLLNLMCDADIRFMKDLDRGLAYVTDMVVRAEWHKLDEYIVQMAPIIMIRYYDVLFRMPIDELAAMIDRIVYAIPEVVKYGYGFVAMVELFEELTLLPAATISLQLMTALHNMECALMLCPIGPMRWPNKYEELKYDIARWRLECLRPATNCGTDAGS
jgi:hypothetical protein